jgi:Holliday junction resolvasome RuvABC endonuclease subunit
MTKYLGLDISSTTIGISLLEEENNIIKVLNVEYYKPPKKDNIFELLSHTREYIIKKILELNPDEIVIEDFSQFMGGASTSATIILLALLNRTIGLTIYEEYSKTPHLLNVNTVRSIIRPKDYNGKLDKFDVPMALEKIIPEYKHNFLYKTKGRAEGKVMDETYDMADSIAVALAYILSKDNVKLNVKKKKSRISDI